MWPVGLFSFVPPSIPALGRPTLHTLPAVTRLATRSWGSCGRKPVFPLACLGADPAWPHSGEAFPSLLHESQRTTKRCEIARLAALSKQLTGAACSWGLGLQTQNYFGRRVMLSPDVSPVSFQIQLPRGSGECSHPAGPLSRWGRTCLQ